MATFNDHVSATQEASADRATLRQVVEFLRRRWLLILICAVVAGAAALTIALSKPKEYTSSSSLFFRQSTVNQDPFGNGNVIQSPYIDPDRQAATNVRLVSLPIIATRTSRALSGALSPDEVQGAVEVEPQGNSDVINVAATTRDPKLSARVADAFANEYIAFRREADRSQIVDAQRLIAKLLGRLSPSERAGARGRALEQRSQDLSFLASLQSGNAELVQQAKPPSGPSAPRPKRDFVIGFLLGALIGLLVSVARDRLERRFRSIDEIEAAFNRPLLGAIPESKALQDRRVLTARIPHQDAEAFQLLRANLRYFNIDRPTSTILVTSAESADGKSTVSYYMAAAAARAGVSVAVVEADLRRPAFAAELGLAGKTGLTQVLSGQAEIDDAIHEIAIEPASRRDDSEVTLSIIPSGPLPPNPVDLMESERMKQVLAECEERFDLVIIDVPPLVVVSDAIPLIREVDGVIVVSRLAKTRKESTARLRDQLDNLQAPVMGIVVNGFTPEMGYGYGYAYLAPSTRELTDDNVPTTTAS